MCHAQLASALDTAGEQDRRQRDLAWKDMLAQLWIECVSHQGEQVEHSEYDTALDEQVYQ